MADRKMVSARGKPSSCPPFLISLLGGWIEQFGEMSHNAAAVKLGVIAGLLMPSETLWRRAAFEMQSPIVKAVGMSPFNNASVPSAAMIVYASVYAAIALWLAI